MTDPFTDINAWMNKHKVEMSHEAYLALEGLLTDYHMRRPPVPRGLPVVEQGQKVTDWSRFENKS